MTSTKETQVIVSVERRRYWKAHEKKAIVEETQEIGKSISSVARHHNLSPSQIFKWRRQYEEGALTGVGSEERVVPESLYRQAVERIRSLERILGQKTEEVEILKEAVRLGREKKQIWRNPYIGTGVIP
jgi:transposase